MQYIYTILLGGAGDDSMGGAEHVAGQLAACIMYGCRHGDGAADIHGIRFLSPSTQSLTTFVPLGS